MNFRRISSSFRRYFSRSKVYPRCTRRKITIFICFILSLTIIFLHFLLLPAVTGAYNDDCYLTEDKLNNLRHLILTSSKLLEKYKRTYWLDFGTLLGAVKFGDVIPWDGDADISSLYIEEFNPSAMNEEFATHGIHRNSLVALVNRTQLDYYRWTVHDSTFSGIKEKVLKKYYPKWITDNDNILVKLEHSRETVPLSWVVPTKKIDFLGVPVAVPGQYEKILDARYPMTYRFNIFTPYKWKCWLPCWLTGDKTCKHYFARKLKQKTIPTFY